VKLSVQEGRDPKGETRRAGKMRRERRKSDWMMNKKSYQK